MPPGDPSALALALGRALDDAELRARIGAAGRARVLERFTWRKHRRGHGRALPRAARRAERSAGALMLTVDFERLDLRDREHRCSTSAAVADVTRSRRCAAARSSSPLDADAAELKDAAAVTLAGCSTPASCRTAPAGGVVNGDALALPFPDGRFDRIIAAEVLEHIRPTTSARSRELVRVLRPGGRHGGHGADPVARTDLLGARPPATTTRPAGTSASTGSPSSRRSSSGAGLVLRGSHHAHALHSPYWWLKCAVGVEQRRRRGRSASYHDFLVWDLTEPPPVGPSPRPGAQPRPGQEPRHLRSGEGVTE